MRRLGHVSVVVTVIACSSTGDLADGRHPVSKWTSSGSASGAGGSGDAGAADGGGGAPISPTGTGGYAGPTKGPPPLGGASNAGGTDAAGGIGGTGGAGVAGLGGYGGALPPEPSCDRIDTSPGNFNPCGSVETIAYSHDGALLAIGGEQRAPNVHVYRMSDGALVHAIDGIAQRTMSVAFSPDGAILAVGGQSPNGTVTMNQPDIVKLYDVKSGSELRTLPVSCGFYASSVAFSSDGALLATAGGWNDVEVWRVSDGTRVTDIPYPSSVHNVHFGPSDGTIIVGGYDKRATVWEIPSGKKVLELAPTTDEMAEAIYSPDGSQIATTGPGNDVQIWDAASGKLIQRIASHSAYVSHILWLDQDHIVSNDWSGVVTWMKRDSSSSFAVGASWSVDAGLGIALSPDKKALALGRAQDGTPGFEFFAVDPAEL